MKLVFTYIALALHLSFKYPCQTPVSNTFRIWICPSKYIEKLGKNWTDIRHIPLSNTHT
ncbi:hypothetical protein V6Z12_D09G219400 [Gossypium hirsutum]